MANDIGPIITLFVNKAAREVTSLVNHESRDRLVELLLETVSEHTRRPQWVSEGILVRWITTDEDNRAAWTGRGLSDNMTDLGVLVELPDADSAGIVYDTTAERGVDSFLTGSICRCLEKQVDLLGGMEFVVDVRRVRTIKEHGVVPLPEQIQHA